MNPGPDGGPAKARWRVALALLACAASASAQNLAVKGACRDGAPHGAWQLEAPDGKLRALGAFNRGKRTGSFIYWNAAGVRIAHVPYEEDAMNGTFARWYERPGKDGDGPQRQEATYHDGKLHGVKREWHADGVLRSEYTYAEGVLVAASAWDRQGRVLPEREARAQAERDLAADEAFFGALDALVRRHSPACGPGAADKTAARSGGAGVLG